MSPVAFIRVTRWRIKPANICLFAWGDEASGNSQHNRLFAAPNVTCVSTLSVQNLILKMLFIALISQCNLLLVWSHDVDEPAGKRAAKTFQKPNSIPVICTKQKLFFFWFGHYWRIVAWDLLFSRRSPESIDNIIIQYNSCSRPRWRSLALRGVSRLTSPPILCW